MMGLIVPAAKTGISDHFAERLTGIPASPEAVAYVVGVLGKRKWDGEDLSNQSVLLAYLDANERGDFVGFQRIGDWVLFIDSVMPAHFNGVREFVESVGRLSYYRCFRLMGQQWRVYEELADEFPRLVTSVRKRLV
jgi:hypothetical protein